MGLAITSIDQLDAALVDQEYLTFIQLMHERHPELDLSRGVFNDLLAYFAGGVAGAINQAEINRVLRARSLKAILDDPSLADPDIVDDVLSNYMLTRRAGNRSTGTITVIVIENLTTVIPVSTIFTANGVDFKPDHVVTARPQGSVLTSSTDRLLQPLGDGRYSFSFPATAVVNGVSGNIKRNSPFTVNATPGNYLNSYAGTDFVGGSAEELNAELIARQQEGIAARVMQGRTNIVSLLKSQPNFSEAIDFSIIGYGNAEMHRDRHCIFPVSSGGRVDIYARTEVLYQTIAMRKTASLVEKTAAGGIWQVAFSREEAPGFYEVDQILLLTDNPLSTSGFDVTTDRRSFDLPADEFVPDIANEVEAAYTAYQTAVIRFLDTVTPTASLTVGSSQQEYIVAVRMMNKIADLQQYCHDRGVRHLSSDVLMKAPVPCFLSLNFTIEQGAGEVSPDLSIIKNAVAARINSLGFTGQLHASLVHDTVHNYLTSRQAVSKIDLHGRIRRPSGASQIIRANDVLVIPDDPGNLVTPRTVGFFLSPDDIGVSVIVAGFEGAA